MFEFVADRVAAALAALDFPPDASITLALTQTVAALGPYWRPALAAGKHVRALVRDVDKASAMLVRKPALSLTARA